jgi:tyrosyl-tRNA synthetase
MLVFPLHGQFVVPRKEGNGGDITFTSYEELEKAYLDESLHPGDLKPALATAINAMIEPVRNHFKTNDDAKKLLATIKRYQQMAEKTKAAAAPQVVDSQ